MEAMDVMDSKNQPFVVTVASGKGGTGKTTVATSLATLAPIPALYADCDVEEPNGALFLSPRIESRKPFEAFLPHLDPDKCTGCGTCQEVCEFNAILLLDRPVLFAEECHSCAACITLCPEQALSEKPHRRGEIAIGRRNGLRFIEGRLDVGQAAASPLVGAVRHEAASFPGAVIIDASPGVSCPVVEASRGVDYLLLVTEPTPLGAHDLDLALELAHTLSLPAGVVVNRSGSGDDSLVEEVADKHHAPVLATIPFDRRIAQAYARGELITESRPELERTFQKIWQVLLSERS
jgi:MinD superfamily P-loop ATPase